MTGIKDADGVEVREGDIIHFSYGIPPIGVNAPVIRRDGKLIAITAGHNPPECLVRMLERHVGYFWVDRSRPGE
jgi:hypothetical protein